MATHDPQSTTSVDAFRNSAMVIMEESDAKDTNAYIVAFQRRRKMRIVAIATGALLVLGVAAAVVVATDSTADNASTSSGRDRLPLNAAGGNNGGGSQSPSTTTVDDTFVGGPEIYFTHTTLSPGSPSNVHGGSTTSSGKHSDVDGGSTASSNHGKNPGSVHHHSTSKLPLNGNSTGSNNAVNGSRPCPSITAVDNSIATTSPPPSYGAPTRPPEITVSPSDPPTTPCPQPIVTSAPTPPPQYPTHAPRPTSPPATYPPTAAPSNPPTAAPSNPPTAAPTNPPTPPPTPPPVQPTSSPTRPPVQPTPPPTRPPVQPTPPLSGSDLKAQIVHQTSVIRAGYGLGPVTWNDDLAKKMQAWADSCPQKTGGGHGGPPGNQNLASFIVCGNNCMHEPGPAQTWWDSEEELWDYDANKSRDGNWMTTGHFQNSLDPGVNEIACGWSTCFNPIANQDDSLVWCNYIGGTNGRIPRPIISKAEIKARIIK
ncbi:hypothetical protein DYB26_004874 [Aphanomyces astaci]|uniref:SCP domain-containing protein n=1 Tax=Aphanomyces astaci TaxID=112090 RepID=A0A418D318_APHAT|nr:hypothetical protein DYB26_004874 [Aphanomyces astaci]